MAHQLIVYPCMMLWGVSEGINMCYFLPSSYYPVTALLVKRMGRRVARVHMVSLS